MTDIYINLKLDHFMKLGSSSIGIETKEILSWNIF